MKLYIYIYILYIPLRNELKMPNVVLKLGTNFHIIHFSYNGGKCVDGINRYTCDCPVGFSGPDCRVSEYRTACRDLMYYIPLFINVIVLNDLSIAR